MRGWPFVVLLVACGPAPRYPNFDGLRAFEARHFELSHDVQLFSAKNGLKVALIPDQRTNLVSVDVRYTVGAAEDPEGRAGLAHLVEHLMFTLRAEAGGPTLGDELAEAALSYNAYTTWDETHYTSTALAAHLPALIDLEGRRLEATCDQIDDAVFVRERDVVLEEQAQRDDGLDGLAAELRTTVFGKDHPYARGVGTREIADVTKQEACDFIAAHYAPDRAIVVVTGAIDVDDATAKIGKRFGPMTRHSTGARARINAPFLDGGTSEHVGDVDEPSAMVFFERPAWGGASEVVYRLDSQLIEAALNRADREADWITGSAVFELGGMRASTVVASLSVSDPERLQDAADAVYAAIRKIPEMSGTLLPILKGRLRAAYAAAYDSFEGRGAWIADYLQYRTDNHLMLDELGEIDLADRDLGRLLQRSFVEDLSHVALIRPSGKPARAGGGSIAASNRDYDLAIWRPEVDPAEARAPLAAEATRIAARVEELTLDNGLHVMLAPDLASPVIDARVVFPVGTSADPDDQHGLAQLAAGMLDHDYNQKLPREDLERAEWAIELGTVMSSDVDETHTTFRAEGLAVFADWHVWRLGWLLDQGAYDGNDLRAVKERLAASPDRDDQAWLVLRQKLFGADHPYASPTAALAGVAKIARGDLIAFRKAHYSLRGATLIVAGGFDPDKMKHEIGELFGWDAGEPTELAAPEVPAPAAGPSYLAVHDDGAAQVQLAVGFAVRSNRTKTRAARMILRRMIEDRVRAVREGLGASYGLDVAYIGGTGGYALIVTGAVDPARATEALALILASLAEVSTGGDALAEDFVRARRRAIALVLADSCGASDLAGELQGLVESDLPLDGYDQLAAEIGATTLDDLDDVIAKDLATSRMAVMASGAADAVDAAITAAAAGAKVETYEPN